MRLEICKSAVDGDALSDFFDLLRRGDGQPTDPLRKSVAGNYRSVSWTPRRADRLADFYLGAPLWMQCQGGDGQPLPGRWDGGVEQPPVPEEADPERPACETAEAEEERRRRRKRVGFSPNAVAILRERTKARYGDEQRRRRKRRIKRGIGSVVKRVGFSPKNVDLLRRMYKEKMEEDQRRRRRDLEKRTKEEEQNENQNGGWGRYLSRLLWMDKRVGQPMNEMKRSHDQTSSPSSSSSSSFSSSSSNLRTRLLNAMVKKRYGIRMKRKGGGARRLIRMRRRSGLSELRMRRKRARWDGDGKRGSQLDDLEGRLNRAFSLFSSTGGGGGAGGGVRRDSNRKKRSNEVS